MEPRWLVAAVTCCGTQHVTQAHDYHLEIINTPKTSLLISVDGPGNRITCYPRLKAHSLAQSSSSQSIHEKPTRLFRPIRTELTHAYRFSPNQNQH